MIKTRRQLIKAYIDFFKTKKHAEVPNASLIPEHDPTVLFTTAGMHPLVPFLLGQTHPQDRRLVNVQKCIRTQDIDDVGDGYHHTFFEMLGNWSLGDYWKEDAIRFSFEFLTKILKIPKDKIAVTCFAGDKDAPKDTESAKIWQELGTPGSKIKFLGKKENWWGPAGKTGPCGPCTEMFYFTENNAPKKFNPKDKRWIEIWNDVFMQYIKDEKGNYNIAKQKNVDTGMGVERTISILTKTYDDYITDSFLPIIRKIEKISEKGYEKNKNNEQTRSMRIIADHIKASVFILAEGICPNNLEQGYVLRRLIRRAVRHGKKIGIKNNFIKHLAEPVFRIYDDYPKLQDLKTRSFILEELEKEEKRFEKTLQKGLNVFEKIKNKTKKQKKEQGKKQISGKDAFLLYQSYGFPLEMTQELAKEHKLSINLKDYEKELKKHQKLSKTATIGRFKSGLADKSEQTTKLHTATHLLLAALRKILKDKNIIQRGSNITPERLRFDFTFPRKLTEREIKQVEEIVNKQIKKSCEVIRQEMSLKEARNKNILGTFGDKYGERVSVYSVGDFSKEICAGPHVKNTYELGRFKIIKEESSSAGVRRIKAVLE